MASWAAKRRFAYGGIVIVILALLAGSVFYKLVYKAPTCFDGVKNGDELGVDCGGACQKICSADTLPPVVLWSKIFNISGDVYTATAYVENPNINSKNPKADYEFKIYDANNKLLTVVKGETSIPKNKKFAVFETNITLKNATPKSADFAFTSFANWMKDTSPEPDINLVYSPLLSATSSPRITGTITNNSTQSVDGLELAVLVLDANENVVATGRSFVDNLFAKTAQDFVFTWPKPFNLGVEACNAPVDVALALDKSGSMRSEGSNPPEPFTTVLDTAKEFVNTLVADDEVAVTSFGTNSKQESALSADKSVALSAIGALSLGTTSENTNITGGLTDAWNELRSDGRPDSKKVIILLTDGIPTEPTDAAIPDYPTVSAQKTAKDIIASGVTIYTIGLGKSASSAFLKSISTDDAHYFEAPSKDALSGIYKAISSNLCTKKPNVITVIYRPI
jgi:hypothetical protein